MAAILLLESLQVAQRRQLSVYQTPMVLAVTSKSSKCLSITILTPLGLSDALPESERLSAVEEREGWASVVFLLPCGTARATTQTFPDLALLIASADAAPLSLLPCSTRLSRS